MLDRWCEPASSQAWDERPPTPRAPRFFSFQDSHTCLIKLPQDRSSRIHTISIWLSKVHLQSIRSKTELLIFCLRFSYLVNDTNLVAQAKNTELFFILFFFSPPSCNTLARPYHQYISRTTHFSPSPRPPSWYKANAMVQVLSACTAATASYKLPCFYHCFLYNYFSTA